MKKNTRTLTLNTETILKLTKGGEEPNLADPVLDKYTQTPTCVATTKPPV